MGLARIRELEHELGMTPCSDLQCLDCRGLSVAALTLQIWSKNLAFALAPRMEKR